MHVSLLIVARSSVKCYDLSLRIPLAASGPASLVAASLFVASASFDSEKQRF